MMKHVFPKKTEKKQQFTTRSIGFAKVQYQTGEVPAKAP